MYSPPPPRSAPLSPFRNAEGDRNGEDGEGVAPMAVAATAVTLLNRRTVSVTSSRFLKLVKAPSKVSLDGSVHKASGSFARVVPNVANRQRRKEEQEVVGGRLYRREENEG